MHDLLLSMTNRSNTSQKNKGDIAEMVSLPFTCVKNIYGNYIRNYVVTWNMELSFYRGKTKRTVTRKRMNIIVGYIAPNRTTLSSEDKELA